jgi:protein tyrosine/serine phosphatase
MKIRNLLISFAVAFSISSAFATPAPLLTFDKMENIKSEMPRNFRDLKSLGINAIASSQFSESQLQEVRKKYPDEQITIVDLRAESHGFINGKPVTWHTVFEKGNQDKTLSEISSDESDRLNLAAKDQQIIVNKILKEDRANGWYKEISPTIVDVNQAISEKDLAEKNGFKYQRFPIRDLDVPNETEFTRMVNFIKTLPQDQKLYVHCAAGKGRTGTFLVLLDIIKNGKTTELKEIFERQNKLGAARLDKISTEESWSKEIARNRLKIIENFYKTETAK